MIASPRRSYRERPARPSTLPGPPLEATRPLRAAAPLCVPPLEATADATDVPLPDLLNVRRASSLEAARIEKVISFAFVVGDDGGVLESVLDQAPLARSTFEPDCFFHELFVEELLSNCMRVRIDGQPVALNTRHLLRLLTQPPQDPGIVEARSEVWRVLANDKAARKALEQLYTRLTALRKLLAGEERLGIRGEQARRRVEILTAIHGTFMALSAPALSAHGGLLARLGEFARYVEASPGHQRLCELLRYESERAYADLTLQLGADGSVRALSLRALREDEHSRYHQSTTRRWLERLLLWLKGYRISEGEVLDRYLDEVFAGVLAFLPPLLQLIGDLELYLAGLALRDGCLARGLAVCFAELSEQPSELELTALFNPLLFALDVVPTPCSLRLGPGGVSTLVTGPNSGGKTRLLQALGLVQLCAQAGMYVPAARAKLPRVAGIFASLSQPSSAEQAEGRLGTELLRIRMLFERAEPGYLVLIDELCSGTSPSEGEELFRMVLELLVELAPTAVISTHFLRLAASLASEPTAPPLRFLQVELDPRQRPTYRFVEGVAETSLAKQTAARLGVTREELLALLEQKRSAPREPTGA